MPDRFHYHPLLSELSEAIRGLCNASDWLDAPPLDATPDDQRRQELGNLVTARARVMNVWQALDKRIADVEVHVRAQEARSIRKHTKAIRKLSRSPARLPSPSSSSR